MSTADPASVELPEPVRRRVVALAAQVLGSLPAEQVPAPLRKVARFAPARRAKLGGAEILTTLSASPTFREQVAAGLDDVAVDDDGVGGTSAVDDVERALRAFLVRPDGWAEDVVRVAARLADAQEQVTDAQARGRLDQLQAQLVRTRTEAREERDRLRAELDRVKGDNANLRRTLGETRERSRRVEQTAVREVGAAREERERAEVARAGAEAEARRLRGRLAEVEAALDGVRRAEREGRNLGTTRLRLLLDTVTDAAAGLRRELALPPVDARPADTAGALAGLAPSTPGTLDPAARAQAPEDPAVLDDLLGLPQVHVVVDGYNVSKAAWPALSLEAQRTQLLRGLAALVARTGAETTVVFDGADLGPTPPALAAPRGVRVRFSPPGVIADEVIRQLVQAEPQGRPVVVVSSDREVADGVRRPGVRPVPSVALLKLLGR